MFSGWSLTFSAVYCLMAALSQGPRLFESCPSTSIGKNIASNCCLLDALSTVCSELWLCHFLAVLQRIWHGPVINCSLSSFIGVESSWRIHSSSVEVYIYKRWGLLSVLHMSFTTHRMCVRAVGAEGKGDGWVEDTKLANHLLHTSDGALFVCVCKLDHQAGGSTLRGEREEKIRDHEYFTAVQQLQQLSLSL